MMTTFKTEIGILIDNIISLVYFMRGAISYNDMLLKTPGERDRIASFLEKRLDQASNQMYPIY